MKDQIKEIIKELFKSGELSIHPEIIIENTFSNYTLTVKVGVMLDNEVIAENSDRNWMELKED